MSQLRRIVKYITVYPGDRTFSSYEIETMLETMFSRNTYNGKGNAQNTVSILICPYKGGNL